MEQIGAVRRKPRASPVVKFMRKVKASIFTYGPTLVRYSVMPSLILASIYFTEPQPTIWELLNPFTR